MTTPTVISTGTCLDCGLVFEGTAPNGGLAKLWRHLHGGGCPGKKPTDLPRPIAPEDVRVGDRVRWEDRSDGGVIEGLVEKIRRIPDMPGAEFAFGHVMGFYGTPARVTLTLLARPEPEPEALPDDWRVGRKVGRTIYDVSTGRLIGVMDTPALAATVVQAVNERRRDEA